MHTLPGSGTEEVPPMSEIHGVDLTTEGVVTVNVTMERIKDYLADGMYTLELARMKDGASQARARTARGGDGGQCPLRQREQPRPAGYGVQL
ncbi:MAG: hypothetical protein ACLTR5_04475 [Oscillospiraceae bacterium]